MNKMSMTQTVTGIALACLGSVVLVGWTIHPPLLVRMRAEFVGFNTALCFLLLGIAFLLPALNVSKTATCRSVIGLIVLTVGTLVLFENLFGIDLGIDLHGLHAWLLDGSPLAGRMAPNTAIGFVLAGLVLVAQGVQSKSAAVFILLATFTVLMLGLTGLVGYTLQLDLLYSWYKSARMALHTAFGMMLVGFGLWSSWREADWYSSRKYFREDEMIAFIGAALLVVIALTSGVAGFAAQQSHLEKALTDSLPTALKNQTTIFQSTVQQSVASANSVAGRPSLLRLTAALGSDPNDLASRAELERIGMSILDSGMSGIRILDRSKREVLNLGKFADKANIAVALDALSSTLLLWDHTLFLHAVLPLRDSTGNIGALVLEEPLELIAAQFANGEGLGRTGEMGMCFPAPGNKAEVLCFPQFRHPKVYQASRLSINGKPTPMSYAVDGKAGIFKGLDYRGKNVIAAYGPLTTTGLGIVIKKDTEELFAPVREQLQWSIPLLLLLVTLGAMLLRSQIRPLASRLLESNARLGESERFIRTVTDNLPGLVAYWDETLRCRFANKQYLDWFNKTPAEMIGIRIQDLMGETLFALNEPYLRRALLGEQQNFERTLTKTSGEIKSTWANYIPDVDADGKVIGIFVLVSDVTALKQAEEAQRIAATAFESQEAMMITDAETVILRINRAFTEVTGYTAEDIVGKTPRMLKSGQHDAAFYLAMWERISRTGTWQGEIWDRRKNGEIFPNWMTITAVKDAGGAVTHYVGTHTDITLRKAAEKQIHELAFFDPLTNLPNRRMMLDRLEEGLAQAKRFRRSLAVMFLDIDRFKQINDTFGHDVGDKLLLEVSKRLSSCVRSVDTVSRQGGDEFVIVLPEISHPRDSTLIAEKIVMAIRDPVSVDHHVLNVTTSIGIAVFAVDGNDDAQALMKKADAAMYAVKHAGRDGYQLFVEASQAAH